MIIMTTGRKNLLIEAITTDGTAYEHIRELADKINLLCLGSPRHIALASTALFVANAIGCITQLQAEDRQALYADFGTVLALYLAEVIEKADGEIQSMEGGPVTFSTPERVQ